jgi:hypothetical protein
LRTSEGNRGETADGHFAASTTGNVAWGECPERAQARVLKARFGLEQNSLTFQAPAIYPDVAIIADCAVARKARGDGASSEARTGQPHQFRTKNDLIKTQRTQSKPQ